MMLQSYLEELKKTPLLSAAEEKVLWQKANQGDLQAHNKLMTSYQPLVFKLAMGFQLPEAETLELIQEGMVGLLEAAETYDYQRGVAFSLFASYRIKGSMLNYLQKSNSQGLLYLESELSQGFTLADVLTTDAVSPTEAAEKQMLQEKVNQALERLPQKEQQVLTGMFLKDQPAQAVAADINVSLGHVYRLQKRGVRRIRGMLSRFMHELNSSD